MTGHEINNCDDVFSGQRRTNIHFAETYFRNCCAYGKGFNIALQPATLGPTTKPADSVKTRILNSGVMFTGTVLTASEYCK